MEIYKKYKVIFECELNYGSPYTATVFMNKDAKWTLFYVLDNRYYLQRKHTIICITEEDLKKIFEETEFTETL